MSTIGKPASRFRIAFANSRPYGCGAANRFLLDRIAEKRKPAASMRYTEGERIITVAGPLQGHPRVITMCPDCKHLLEIASEANRRHIAVLSDLQIAHIQQD